MKKNGLWLTVVLIGALLQKSPQLVQAERSLDAFSSSGYRLFFDDGYKLSNEKRDVYFIKYFVNGGDRVRSEIHSYTAKDLPITLPIPECEGYNFAGWYTENGFENKIYEIGEEQRGDFCLYAKWTSSIDASYNVQMYSYQTDTEKDTGVKKLKNCAYSVLNDVEIPGMPSTRERDYMNQMILACGQCPQGMCLTNDYYLITAYCSEETERAGSLYVFDRHTGEYLVTLGMKKNSHLGGVAFDGANVWICHSEAKALERIPYEYIHRTASKKPKRFIDSTGVMQEYEVSNVPSCVTFYDGRLWVATHCVDVQAEMISYEYRNDRLKRRGCYKIPQRVQGIAFGEDKTVYLSTSYGRGESSYLKVYENVFALDDEPDLPVLNVEMPPCSEEIFVDGKKLYVLFESAGWKYFEGTDGMGESVAPIDKILAIETDSIGKK